MGWTSVSDFMVGDTTMAAVYEALDGLSARQQASANNIANIETPNFTAKRVDFESSLAQAASSGDPSTMQLSVTPTTDAPRVDGNNVNLGDETILAEKTGLQFQTMVDAMNAKFKLLNTAISGSPGAG